MNPNGFIPGQYLQPHWQGVVGAAYYHHGQPLVPPQPAGMPMHNPPQNILVPQPIQQQPLPQNMMPPQPMMQAYPQWQGWQPNGAYGIPVPQLHPQAPVGWIPQAMPVQFQAQLMGYPQPQAPRVPVQDLGLAERIRPYLRRHRDPASSKVKEKTLLSSDNEKMLVDALKAGKAQGLTMGEVVDKLQKSNADVGWQEGFVRNIEKLLPNVYPSEYGGKAREARSSASGRRLSARSANHILFTDSAQRKHAGPAEGAKHKARDAAHSSRKAHAGPPNQLRSAKNPSAPSRSKTGVSSHTRTRIASSESANGRVLRGDPIPDYHAGTYIPPSPTVSRKPEAPSEESGGSASHFTDADKIFFIQYLRWRLQDIERLPSKLTLLEELAKETLHHHDAESWHKHWDGNWSLPDQIYIAARKWLQACGPSDSDSLTSLSEAESSDNGDDEIDGDSSPNYDDGVSSASANAGNRRAGRGGYSVKVTDDDRRAMALYLVEKRRGRSQTARETSPCGRNSLGVLRTKSALTLGGTVPLEVMRERF
ncbi:hypothetical protein C8Q74DRAFT_1268761 [Fomes fomentarius]|nr:hypothetical protein C8Q74DRAFT_1268761 [Fomes fomentarius]